jgi:nitrate/nitrite transporter NarK
VLVAIYALWGVTSLLTFWPALLKTIRQQAAPAEQGRAYGIFEGGRGVVNALHLAVATAIFGVMGARLGNVAGIKGIITFYSVSAIVSGLIIAVAFKDGGEANAGAGSGNERAEDNAPGSGIPAAVSGDAGAKFAGAVKSKAAGLVTVLKMPSVWMVIVLLFSSYVFNMSFYYFTPYATSEFGASPVFAAVLTVLAQYCRPVASTGGGFLADKFGRSNVLFAGFAALAAGMIAILTIQRGAESTIPLTVACVLVYVAMYGNYGIFFSLLEEGGVPIKVSGTAIGVVSTIGYLPEVICPLIAGKVLDTYKGAAGYQIYFSGMAACAVVGAVFSLIWSRVYGKKRKTGAQISQA